MSRLNRLLQLMQALRHLPSPVTAERLAQETHVSARTIYRDIETLRGSGAIIDGEAGFGYTMTEDPALPPMMFSNDELEALVLGLREVREIGDPVLAIAATSALSKLKARLPDAQGMRLRNAVLTAKRFRSRPEIQIDTRALRTAAWDEIAVDISYVDGNGAASSRRVLPLSIVYLEDTLMLLAWCELRAAYRAFRLDRIKTADVTANSFRPRRVQMLRDCLAGFQQDPPLR